MVVHLHFLLFRKWRRFETTAEVQLRNSHALRTIHVPFHSRTISPVHSRPRHRHPSRRRRQAQVSTMARNERGLGLRRQTEAHTIKPKGHRAQHKREILTLLDSGARDSQHQVGFRESDSDPYIRNNMGATRLSRALIAPRNHSPQRSMYVSTPPHPAPGAESSLDDATDVRLRDAATSDSHSLPSSGVLNQAAAANSTTSFWLNLDIFVNFSEPSVLLVLKARKNSSSTSLEQ